MFANKYIQKNKLSEPLIKAAVSKDVGMVVMIPCLHEPDILETLDSLQCCILPTCKVEVLVLINHSEKAPSEVKNFNRETFIEVKDWIGRNRAKGIQYLLPEPVELQEKWAGAGLARKCGMDEALTRFNQIDKPEGIIVSLDADTLVDKNYLVEIEKHFLNNLKDVGATIAFQHRTDGLDEKNKVGILLYEKYLKYYKEALSFTGYPNAMYTIGSAFAVTADAYVKRGGMTRRKAGEDFYFLQNLAQQGRVGEITTTKVYPSSRPSNRVVFGTGASIKKWLEGTGDLTQTYNFQAFIDLKEFFSDHDKLYRLSDIEYQLRIKHWAQPVFDFLLEDNFKEQLDELNRNCSSIKVFNKRFYHVFNAFKILKFLNYAHEKYYKKANLIDQVELLNKNNR